MPAWLTLMIIVLVSVALFADHRRNIAREAAQIGRLDAVRTASSEPPIEPTTRRSRSVGRSGDMSRFGTPARRSPRAVRRR